MYEIEFETAYARSIGNEGGYKRDPKDRGDWTTGIIGKGECKGTNKGISAMSYPDLDIKNLTDAEIKAIYYKDWWVKLELKSYRLAMAFQLFDAAINHGWHNAARMFQRALGVKDDGVIGKVTKAKFDATDISDVLLLFIAERLEFFRNTATWGTYGRGWAGRVVQDLRYAAIDN